MIKINLLEERKPAKAAKASSSLDGMEIGAGRNILLIGVLLIGVLVGLFSSGHYFKRR